MSGYIINIRVGECMGIFSRYEISVIYMCVLGLGETIESTDYGVVIINRNGIIWVRAQW